MIGVVNHFGSLASGHYTAYVKKDDWFYYDDESVRKSSVNGNNAYLIFYQMVE
jgi:ubiquitin C-terminal hydrolase